MKKSQVLSIVCVVVLFCVHKGYGTDDCGLTIDKAMKVNESIFKLEKIEDISNPGKELGTCTIAGTFTALDIPENAPYVKTSAPVENKFKLVLTSEFDRYLDNGGKEEFSFQLSYNCKKTANETSETKTFKVTVPIKNTWPFAPEFIGVKNNTIVHKVPLPLTKGHDLADIIHATVITGRYRNIDPNFDLSVEGKSFNISIPTHLEEAKFTATLKTNDVIDFTGVLSINVTAKAKKGEPLKENYVILELHADEENSVPKFASAVYEADYSSGLKNGEAIKFTKSITLSRGASEKIEYEIKSETGADFSKNFKHEVNNGTINIIPSSFPSNLNDEHYVTLILNAKKGESAGTTVLMITLPGSLPPPAKERTTGGYTAAIVLLSIGIIAASGGVVFLYKKIGSLH